MISFEGQNHQHRTVYVNNVICVSYFGYDAGAVAFVSQMIQVSTSTMNIKFISRSSIDRVYLDFWNIILQFACYNRSTFLIS